MRRIAALILIFCLLLAVPAAAAPVTFRDLGDITHRSEVMLLVDLGLISGYEDDTFRPAKTITRAETAKLVAMMYTDDPTPAQSAWFSDVDGWAKPYIDYCYSRGIVSGDAGKYRPNDMVTARELAKMLLVTLGNDGSRYTGDQWAVHVDNDAIEQGIYARFSENPQLAISRDDACLLIYNAMLSLAITGYEADGTAVYATDALLNPITYLEQRFGVVRYTALLTGNDCANLTGSGALKAGFTKLAGHKEFAVATDLSLLGQCVDLYVRGGAVLGQPCASSSILSYTFDSVRELQELCSRTDYRLAEDAAYYYNYRPSDATALNHLSEPMEIIVLDQDGDKAMDQVLAVQYTYGQVENGADCTVQINGTMVTARTIRTGDRFADGQSVRCVQVGSQWYIK